MARVDLDGFADDLRRPLLCVQAVTGVEADRTGLTLRCATLRILRRNWARYGADVPVGVPTGPGPAATLRLDVIEPAVLRVRFCRGDRVPDNRTPFLVGGRPRGADLAVAETGSAVRLSTAALTVTVDRAPYRMRVAGAGGRILLDSVGLGMAQPAPTGVPFPDLSEVDRAPDGMAAGWPWFLRGLLPLGFAEDPDSGGVQVFDTYALRPDEHLYGLGEHYGPLDRRGRAVTLWHANALGTTWPEAYKNVPFLLSTAGCGHFLNTAHPVRYHLGDRSDVHFGVQVQAPLLDYFLVAGPGFAEILPRYTELVGRPELPPLWSFGLWMSRMSYQSAAEVEEIGRRLRAERIPCDVLHLDESWTRTRHVNDLVFCPERFADAELFLARLRKEGFRVSVWQIPYISTAGAAYESGLRAGAFATRTNGEPYLISGAHGPTAVIDFSAPAAVEWYSGLLRTLLELGVSAVKTDFGEGAPDDAVYSGLDGVEMHNLYPFLYNRVVHDTTRQVTGASLIWARAAYAGSQRFPVHWGGDSVSRWADLANGLSGGLSLSLCGFPFWSQDIGGFAGTPSPRLYVRWAQVGLLMTHARAHGTTAREPWHFGEQAVDLVRRAVELRYRLLPYLWSESVRCVRIGHPVMRPMVFDWPDDPSTYGIADQYLLGEHLLVAPVLTEDDRRRVYLPAGRWLDLGTGRVRRGPRWLEVLAPLDTVPLFLRADGVLPLAGPAQHTEQLDWTRLRLEVFPVRTGRFVVDRSGAGLPPVAVTHTRGRDRVRVDVAGDGTYELALRGTGRPVRVTVDGREAPWQWVDRTVLVPLAGPGRVDVTG